MYTNIFAKSLCLHQYIHVYGYVSILCILIYALVRIWFFRQNCYWFTKCTFVTIIYFHTYVYAHAYTCTQTHAHTYAYTHPLFSFTIRHMGISNNRMLTCHIFACALGKWAPSMPQLSSYDWVLSSLHMHGIYFTGSKTHPSSRRSIK